MLYRNKNAKLVMLKQNGCQLMIGLVENVAKREKKKKKKMKKKKMMI